MGIIQKAGDELRLFLGIIKSEYIKWLKSDKQLMTAFSMIFLYMYSLEIIKKYSAEMMGVRKTVKPKI